MQHVEIVPQLVLIVFHFAFWWKFYTTDRLCTSEVASNFFPHWVWMGRQLRKGIWPMKDNIYYLEPGSIPFLSTFYPPSFLLSMTGSFAVYKCLILIHSLLGSILSFIMLRQWVSPEIALFGALSLTYNAYMIRPQTPCFMFTAAWLPACLISGWFGAVAFGMAILGGYWPIILTASPIFLYNLSCVWGALVATPQLIPFLRYYPKSIRAKRKPVSAWGRMPLKRFFIRLRWPENGMIHYPEYSFGVGLCLPLALYHFFFQHFGGWAIFTIIGLIGSQGLFILDRIPARFVYLVSISLVMASVFAIRDTIYTVPMIILQAFLLWKNRDIYPSFPFSQWWRKLSEHRYEGTEWPNNTGYMNGIGHQKYFGGFALAENYHD